MPLPGTEPPQADLLGWGLPRLRDLPWRHTRDPWRILVSEVMLQQTQVPRVIPKYHAFLDAYPTTAACAAASLADVLRLWQGLGYPRRARNLQLAAQHVERECNGHFPDSLDALLALPGVGPYTARAVLAFAFERDVAVVDTNIARVLARVAGHRMTPKQVQSAADALVPDGDGWAWNQCLMDLGATLCRPGVPQCSLCPLLPTCAWHGEGDDPAIGSAGVSVAQARFDGSDRQARGRLIKALGEQPLAIAAVAAVMQRPHDRAMALVDALVAEGLVALTGTTVHLQG